ncbi:MAG: hypothetical protein EOM23_05765 [Candidatus Moranbacteria bacterium]|nr:hypothetical protein [Candidatus Moranbacteria bacterium]
MVTFGLQAERLIPSDLFRSSNVRVFSQGVEFTSDPMPGFAYGAHVAFRFNERMALETGINHLVRDYRFTAKEEDFEFPLQFTADNFEIPFTFNYNIRLGEKLFIDQSLGFSFQFLPSEFQSRVIKRDELDSLIYDMSHISVRNYWVMPAFRGGFGFEYRTENSGSFYIGPVYRLFSTLYFTRIIYEHEDTYVSDLDIKPTGDYFSIVFRYIFSF